MAPPEVPSEADSALRFSEAHFPGRAPIDSYGNGGFRFADMSHRGSILCLPSGIYGLDADTIDSLGPHHLQKLETEQGLDFLLIGTGASIAKPSGEVRTFLKACDIRSDPMATGAAVRTFNVLVGEGRQVGAVLLAVN